MLCNLTFLPDELDLNRAPCSRVCGGEQAQWSSGDMETIRDKKSSQIKVIVSDALE